MHLTMADNPNQPSITLPLAELQPLLTRMLVALGLSEENAAPIAWVYTRMTERGVGHHDINDFPHLLDRLHAGRFNTQPKITTLTDHQAIATLDGDNAPGPLAAYRAMETAIAKARDFGIGMAIVRNSNHFLGAAPYTLLAHEHNMIGIAASNTLPGMGLPVTQSRIIGNNPFGFAADSGQSFPLLLDICCAYASYGVLNDYRKNNQPLPEGWALDAAGNPTTSPGAAINNGIPLPIGEHKGLGLAILVELLTSVLGRGAIINDVQSDAQENRGHTQTMLAINIQNFMPVEEFNTRAREMTGQLKSAPLRHEPETLRLPGERTHHSAQQIQRDGVTLHPDLTHQLSSWLSRLRLTPPWQS